MGKPKHSNDTRGDQKGAQKHDEGQYGPKALEAKRAELADHSGHAAANRENDPGNAATHEREMHDPSMRDGRHRLAEERKQHDEADRAQDKNRLIVDIETHGHDRSEFQVPHGRTGHPQAPDASTPAIHSPGESGK
jgi:hypothetical protein